MLSKRGQNRTAVLLQLVYFHLPYNLRNIVYWPEIVRVRNLIRVPEFLIVRSALLGTANLQLFVQGARLCERGNLPPKGRITLYPNILLQACLTRTRGRRRGFLNPLPASSSRSGRTTVDNFEFR